MKTLFSLLSVALFIACLANPLHADSPKRTEWEMKGSTRALFDREPDVIEYALYALRFQQPEYRNRFITPEVARRLARLFTLMPPDKGESEFVEELLTGLGRKGRPYLPSLVAAMQNPATDRNAREWIAMNLSKVDTEKSLLPSFRATLRNKNAPIERRCAAAFAIQYMGGLKPEDAPILLSLVKGKPTTLTPNILSFAGSLGKSSIPPLAELLPLLKRRDIRWQAMELIAKRDDNASRATLLNFINNSKTDLDVRICATSSLEYIKKHELFAPTLTALLQNRKTPKRLRGTTVSLYEQWRDESALPLLVQILRDATPVPAPYDRDIRDEAVGAISAMGKSAVPYIPEMMRYLRQRSVYEQHNSFVAISQIPGGKAIFSSALADIARDSKAERGERSQAMQFLLDMERRNTPILPEIIRWLKTRDSEGSETGNTMERAGIAEELRYAGDALKPFIPELMALVMDKETDSSITSSLVVTLRNLGYPLDSALTMFTNIANDPKQSAAARGRATTLIGNLRPLTLEESLVHLNLTYGKLQEPLKRRFEAYAYSGGDPTVVRLLKWLAPSKPLPKALPQKERAELLQLYKSVLPKTEGLTNLRADLARQITALERGR